MQLGHLNAHADPGARGLGVDDGIHPEPRGSVKGVGLGVVTVGDGAKQFSFLGFVGFLAALGEGRLFDLKQHLGRLFAPHDRNAGRGPRDNQTRVVGFAAHGVVAGAIAVADDHREFGNDAVGDGIDHFGAVLDDASVFRARRTMKPVTSCKNTSGTFRWLQVAMKRAALSALSE